MFFKKAFVAVAIVSTQFTGVFAAAINKPRDFLNFGTSNNVFIKNDSEQTIYVMASLNPDWAVVDFVTDIGLMFLGASEIKAIVKSTRLPATIKSLADLGKFILLAGQLELAMISTGTRPGEAVMAMRNAIKQNSIPIRPGEHKNVKDGNVLDIYLSADGIASILGASNISLLVMSEDGMQSALYNTGSDDSWIATKNQQLVRAKYGTVSDVDTTKEPVPWPRIERTQLRKSRAAGFFEDAAEGQSAAPQTGAVAGADFPAQQPPQQPPQGFEQPQGTQSGFPQQPEAPQGNVPQQPEAPQSGFPQQPNAPQPGFPQQPEAPQGTVPQQPEAAQPMGQPQGFF